MGAAAAIRERAVLAPLDLIQTVQYPIGLFEIDRVLLVVLLLVFVRIEALYFEGVARRVLSVYALARACCRALAHVLPRLEHACILPRGALVHREGRGPRHGTK